MAHAFSGRARAALAVLIDGKPGAVWKHGGELRVAFRFTIAGDRITGIEMVGDRNALERYVIER